MEELILSSVHQYILDKLIMGLERKDIANSLKIKVSTLNSYVRDINYNNDCNLIQLVWMYSQVGIKYEIIKP
jgi:DNA-binding CsgD family transcriptional regulator